MTMDARELLEEARAEMARESDKETIAKYELCIRALSLLAAAEANDGKTPETDAEAYSTREAYGEDGDESVVPADTARTLELSRNGLAAEVVRLTEDAERHRAMRDQFDATKKVSVYLPQAQPRFVDDQTYATPDAYEHDIDRAIHAAVAAIDAERARP